MVLKATVVFTFFYQQTTQLGGPLQLFLGLGIPEWSGKQQFQTLEMDRNGFMTVPRFHWVDDFRSLSFLLEAPKHQAGHCSGSGTEVFWPW